MKLLSLKKRGGGYFHPSRRNSSATREAAGGEHWPPVSWSSTGEDRMRVRMRPVSSCLDPRVPGLRQWYTAVSVSCQLASLHSAFESSRCPNRLGLVCSSPSRLDGTHLFNTWG